MTGLPNINADFHYYNWTDQFNASGFGDEHADRERQRLGFAADPRHEDRPHGRSCACRIRSGSITRGLDGRIDDPNAGWKGRGLWANYGTNFLWHIEGGKGTTSKMVKFQVRPDPLAR